MRYATMRYVDDERPNYLELQFLDGTTRGVLFRDATAKAAALLPGRADIDCTAVMKGILPRGATLVSRAGKRDLEELLGERPKESDATSVDPLAKIRLGFSLELLVRQSEYITEERDAEARRRNPDEARIYEGIVDELERDRR